MSPEDNRLTISHALVVVGGGLAGLRAALEARLSGIDVAVVSKVFPLRSHSCMAQGGLNAALGNHPDASGDSPGAHAYDTIKGSDFLADQDAVEAMTREGIEVVYEMDHWGCPWSRFANGKIAQRPFGGQSYPRTCFGADKTGLYLLQTLYEQCLKHGVRFYDEFLILSLVALDGRCSGLVAYEIANGRLHGIQAKAVVFATGGAGRLFSLTSNSLISTGFGVAMAFLAGVPVKDMEFFQFHPTTLVGQGTTISEGLRGAGAYLINRDGDRFMARYVSESVMERAPRDITARSIQTEIDEGRGIDGHSYVYLDARHLGADWLRTYFPGIIEVCQEFRKIDATREPIPVRPGAHYMMGGIDVNIHCETELRGFFAAGECACVSVHGANRLGANSLLETIVFGRRAGRSVARFLRLDGGKTSETAVADAVCAIEDELCKLVEGSGKEVPARLRKEMNAIMDDNVTIFRSEENLKKAVIQIQALRERYNHLRPIYGGNRFNYDLIWAFELKGSLVLAEIVAAGALSRQESRGAHYRRDYPKRDDPHWLCHTIAWAGEGGPTLKTKPVSITNWPPVDRIY